jgi:Holliday junction DNA helicase RuvB
VQRTPRGRVLTGQAFRHLGLDAPAGRVDQMGLFADDEDR